MAQVKIRLPSTIAKGQSVAVRALVVHPMETVQRDKDGKVVDKVYNYVHTVSADFNGKAIFSGQLTQSVSANPFVTFAFVPQAPGKLTVTFEDTTGEKHTGSVDVAF
ncbi:MAG: thiosulfate oxidation carrier complex protein SoxZ [Magnetospirillum sp. WYHS-4]